MAPDVNGNKGQPWVKKHINKIGASQLAMVGTRTGEQYFLGAWDL